MLRFYEFHGPQSVRPVLNLLSVGGLSEVGHPLTPARVPAGQHGAFTRPRGHALLNTLAYRRTLGAVTDSIDTLMHVGLFDATARCKAGARSAALVTNSACPPRASATLS